MSGSGIKSANPMIEVEMHPYKGPEDENVEQQPLASDQPDDGSSGDLNSAPILNINNIHVLQPLQEQVRKKPPSPFRSSMDQNFKDLKKEANMQMEVNFNRPKTQKHMSLKPRMVKFKRNLDNKTQSIKRDCSGDLPRSVKYGLVSQHEYKKDQAHQAQQAHQAHQA